MSISHSTNSVTASGISTDTLLWTCHYPSGSPTRHQASGSVAGGSGMWSIQTVTFETGGMTDAQYNGLLAAINGTTSAVQGTTSAVNTSSTNEVAKVDAAMNYGVVGLAAVLFVVGFAMGYRITFRRGGL